MQKFSSVSSGTDRSSAMRNILHCGDAIKSKLWLSFLDFLLNDYWLRGRCPSERADRITMVIISRILVFSMLTFPSTKIINFGFHPEGSVHSSACAEEETSLSVVYLLLKRIFKSYNLTSVNRYGFRTELSFRDFLCFLFYS